MAGALSPRPRPPPGLGPAGASERPAGTGGVSCLFTCPAASPAFSLCPLSDARGSPQRTVTPGSQRGSLWGSRFLGLFGSHTYWQGAIAVCVRVSAPAVGFLRLGACRVWGALLEPSVAPGCPLHTHTLGLIFSSSLPCSQPRSLQAAQAPGGQAHCPGLPWVVPTLSPPATLAQGPHVRPVDPN